MNIERSYSSNNFSDSLFLEELKFYSDDEIGYQPNKRPILTVKEENNRVILDNEF